MPTQNKESSVLVIGSDSLIGAALVEQLKNAGVPVSGTTRKRETLTARRSYLDLAENVDEWRPDEKPAVAVICAGITNVERCRLDPVTTARVNVQAVRSLAHTLANEGTFIIYLSSNQVFDGTRSNRLPDEPTSPRTEYGKQKAAVEKDLLLLGDAVSIVRLTKVLSPQMPLLQSWLAALQAGQAIHPFKDMVMAPVSLSFTISVLQKLIEARLPGIMQVSAEQDVTYAATADHIAERSGAAAALVQSISARDAGLPLEATPRHTTLDTRRLRMELGLDPPGVWTTIDEAIGI